MRDDRRGEKSSGSGVIVFLLSINYSCITQNTTGRHQITRKLWIMGINSLSAHWNFDVLPSWAAAITPLITTGSRFKSGAMILNRYLFSFNQSAGKSSPQGKRRGWSWHTVRIIWVEEYSRSAAADGRVLQPEQPELSSPVECDGPRRVLSHRVRRRETGGKPWDFGQVAEPKRPPSHETDTCILLNLSPRGWG